METNSKLFTKQNNAKKNRETSKNIKINKSVSLKHETSLIDALAEEDLRQKSAQDRVDIKRPNAQLNKAKSIEEVPTRARSNKSDLQGSASKNSLPIKHEDQNQLIGAGSCHSSLRRSFDS